MIPIIWPLFRDLSPIPLQTWKAMCDWLKSHYCVDGIMVYSWKSELASNGWREALITP